MSFYRFCAAALLLLVAASCRGPAEVDGRFQRDGHTYVLSDTEAGVVYADDRKFYFTHGMIDNEDGRMIDWDSLRIADRREMAAVAESAIDWLDRCAKRKPLPAVFQLDRRILQGFLRIYRSGAVPIA